MTSSEIEIVSDLTPQGETAVGEEAENTNTVTVDNVFAASFYGDLEKLRKFVEQDGASLSLPDNNGYYALHWAALKRFPQILHYIIQHGGDANAVDNSQQTALHWAASEGSISIADLLLQNGARVEAADVNGYRAVHIAAQCGRTLFLNHIVAKHNADFDVPDNDGRSPLHWAAYKGFADIVRFLLSRYASQDRRDKQGNTPIQLASDKCHRQVALLLSNALQAQGKQLKNSNSTIGKNWPMIIAMQGDRYTGKSFLAEKLAFRLKCPLICLDDFLDSSEATDEQDSLISRTFCQIAHIVKTQISLGFSVVIDSPLSRLSHLHQLVSLISTRNRDNTQLLIMECKPKNKYAFQLIFEERGSAIYDSKWYKPAGVWPLPELHRDYTDDDIPHMVSKLVVNTTDYYSVCQMFTAVYDVTSCGSGHIIEYTSCWHVIHTNKAEQFICPTCTSSESSSDYLTTRDDNLHKLTLHQGVGHGNKLCGVCDNLGSGPCYSCKDCPLTLHKTCAELARGGKKHFEPKDFPRFMSTEPRLAYSFPVEHPCVECREDRRDFSSKCEHCLFESHLKSRLVPTVVQHKAHDHFCTLKIDLDTGGRTYNYMCLACRKYGKFSAYFMNVHVMYHPECLLLPPSLSHSHGGYTHDVEIVFGNKDELEDYMCDCCQEKMDAKAWYYYCCDCRVSLHLECAFKDFD